MEEAMWRTVRAHLCQSYKVMTAVVEPSAQQQAVIDWLSEERDRLNSNQKIGMANHIRLAAVSPAALLWHVEVARLEEDKSIPQNREAQEAWMERMGFEADHEVSDLLHR